MGSGIQSIVTIEMLVLCLLIVESMGATVHTVGDSAGWTLGVNYDTWSTSQTFLVGDTLEFKYGSGHTVDEVSENEYKTCTEAKPISSDSTGSTSIVLQTPGTHYFVCGVVGHCSSGMKVSVLVSTSAASPSTSSSSTNGSSSNTPCTTSTPIPTTPPVGYGYGTMIPYSASHPLDVCAPLVIFVVAIAIL